MTSPPNLSAEQAAHHELITRLREMSTALESGDDALFSERLHALLRRREESFYLHIARITDDLKKAFESLESDQRWNAIATELPDAGARLEHVSQLTEKAAHHTLDLVEAGQRELKVMGDSMGLMATVRARLLMASAGSGALMHLAKEVQQLELQLQVHLQSLRNQFSELAQSQEYQDLSGQILRRVTHVVREVEAALLKLLDGRAPVTTSAATVDSKLEGTSSSRGLEGPTVKGIGNAAIAAGQDDADALLAMFSL